MSSESRHKRWCLRGAAAKCSASQAVLAVGPHQRKSGKIKEQESMGVEHDVMVMSEHVVPN